MQSYMLLAHAAQIFQAIAWRNTLIAEIAVSDRECRALQQVLVIAFVVVDSGGGVSAMLEYDAASRGRRGLLEHAARHEVRRRRGSRRSIRGQRADTLVGTRWRRHDLAA